MDASKIFIIVLSTAFFGVIAYLAVMSRRNNRTDAFNCGVQADVETAKSEEPKPRNAA